MIELLAQMALTTALLAKPVPTAYGAGWILHRPSTPGVYLRDIRAWEDHRTAGAIAYRTARAPDDGRSLQIPLPKRNWAPCIGAAIGAVTMGAVVADEEDFSKGGKLMWVGIGAAGGAAIGWLVGKIVGP